MYFANSVLDNKNWDIINEKINKIKFSLEETKFLHQNYGTL